VLLSESFAAAAAAALAACRFARPAARARWNDSSSVGPSHCSFNTKPTVKPNEQINAAIVKRKFALSFNPGMGAIGFNTIRLIGVSVESDAEGDAEEDALDDGDEGEAAVVDVGADVEN